MKAVVQRVNKALVEHEGKTHSLIQEGLLILLGITPIDTEDDLLWLSGKISNLRIFDDEAGTMNKSVIQINGEILVVSQFTLMASTKKGNRPSYVYAAKPELAIPLYEKFVEQLRSDTGLVVKTGIFGAEMQVHLVNNGPVTILLDTKNKE
mgnify:CR=1 FL=1|jgi:D-tyrosyl-tRNA(Tyr) deacylase